MDYVAQQSSSDDFAGVQFVRGIGAYCWDTSGRRYIDMVCGQGPVILGHANERVTAAIASILPTGNLFPGPGPEVADLRDRLLRYYPGHDEMLLFKTGSEAIAAAIRLCRAETGRSRILRVGFHGWHDQVVSPYVRPHSFEASTFEYSMPRGVPHDSLKRLVYTWHGDDPFGLLEVVSDSDAELAAVIVDPVQLRPPDAALVARELLPLAHDHGTLVIFDESKTGFRVGMGGAQGLYGVQADFTVLSKGLANGFPLAAVLGNGTLPSLSRECQVKGTFRFERTAVVAANATLDALVDFNVPQRLEGLGSYFAATVNEALHRSLGAGRVNVVPYQWACMPFFRFAEGQSRLRDYFFGSMLQRGVLLMRNHMSYISYALTREDIDELALATEAVMCDWEKAPH